MAQIHRLTAAGGDIRPQASALPQECYRMMLRYGTSSYPQWVRETADKRLLALHRIPESALFIIVEKEREST